MLYIYMAGGQHPHSSVCAKKTEQWPWITSIKRALGNSVHGQYELNEWLQHAKPLSDFIWASDLKSCVQHLLIHPQNTKCTHYFSLLIINAPYFLTKASTVF